MRYADIKTIDVANGISVGVALFVQGCRKHCKGCFNQETWNFDDGKEWTKNTMEYFLKLVARSYIKRISILGGEPLEKENIECITELVKEIRKRFGNDKKIWLYSGNLFEDAKDLEVIKYLDVMVDGPFVEELKNINLRFRGSENQRLIDIQASLLQRKVVMLE